MIPKVIHYCWFGGNPLDEKAKKCLESWRKYFPDYEIKEWNENNFDFSNSDFMKKAYENKKWAFVSDLARLIIIYENGGIYFDTDVEVVRSYGDILGKETKGFIGIERDGLVASGLGFGAERGHPFLKEHIDLYKKIEFDKYIDHLSDIACPILTTNLLENKGYVKKNYKQIVGGLEIYPSEYFAPIDYKTGKIKITECTHSIHWYSASWQSQKVKEEQECQRRLRAILGTWLGESLYGIISCIKHEGITNYVKRRIEKVINRRMR